MARQNIQFKGLRHSPSDITGQDGDLLECVNLIHENGELKPIEMPERMQQPRSTLVGEVLMAVHNLTDGKKFVFANNTEGSWSYIRVKDEDGNTLMFGNIDFKQIMGEVVQWVETIGQTLIIGTDKSTHYALYKNGQYKWLGDKLPQPVFEFDMGENGNSTDECLDISVTDNTFYDYGGGDSGNGWPLNVTNDEITSSQTDVYTYFEYPTDELIRDVRDAVKSDIVRIIHKSKEEKRFIFPFFVRYAVRMFDNNYALHSAPILMLPSTFKCPILSYLDIWTQPQPANPVVAAWPTFKVRAKSLVLKFVGFFTEDGVDVTEDIQDWGDIIKGVDLFLSSQIVTYDESYFDEIDNFPKRYYNRYADGHQPDYGDAYARNNKEDWLANHAANGFNIDEQLFSTNYYKNQYFPIPSYDKSTTLEKIKNNNLFYLAKSFDLLELTDEDFIYIEKYSQDIFDRDLLDRLETLPTLPDDYVSRNRMTGMANYNYNQRLMLGNIKLQAPLWYQDAKTFDFDNYDLKIFFEIEKQEKTIVIEYDKPLIGGVGVGEMDFGHYIYYPDPDCKRAIIRHKVQQPGSMVYAYNFIDVPMYEHTGLHGSYALMPDLQSLHESFDDFHQTTEPTPSSDIERYYQMPNTIAMSSVANPFHFPATNFKDIGRTKVVGIAANTLDVSSGQWGQYPIYVFCSDGIIAVMIDGEGKFGGIQAVSADVLRDPQGLSQPTLVQTGQTLMFLTQRGVMAIAGTKIMCVSEAMEGRHFNPLKELSPTSPTPSVLYNTGAFASLIRKTNDDTDFRDFAASGFLAYDYAHNRVLLLRSDKDYQYVYSMNTGMWSKQIVYTNIEAAQLDEKPSNTLPAQRSILEISVKPMLAAVNNYTEMYLQDNTGRLYRTMEVSGENNEKRLYQYGYFISRPIRFGTDEYKTLVRVLHRYTHYANNSFVKMALYGSRDGVRYGRINTLRGMSYQYFIFVIYTYLKPNERYSYLSVDFEPRLTNKLR